MSKLYEVKMFGNFSLKSDDVIIDENIRNSKKIWLLLGYVIYNRKRAITEYEAIKLLWPSSSNNPTNNLKNLLFRLRELLKEQGLLEYQEIIIYKNSTLRWNEEILCKCDYEDFENLTKISHNINLPINERISAIKKALALYTNGFLEYRTKNEWVKSINSYFHLLYINLIKCYIDILKSNNDWHSINKLCSQIMSNSMNEELVHYNLIYSLFMLEKYRDALIQFEESKNYFYKKLGSELSPAFQSLYTNIISYINRKDDLDNIKSNLDDSNYDGCMECEYEVFKNIYTLFKRENTRNKKNNYLVLFSISSENSILTDERLIILINSLGSIIKSSTRLGDIMTRYSNSQYLLLLNYINKESDIIGIINRIKNNFDNINKLSLKIKYVKLEENNKKYKEI